MRPTAEQPRGRYQLQRIPYRGHDLLADAVVRNVKPGGRILEGGCASGYFAGVLQREGFEVDGIELDADDAKAAAEVCDHLVVGDLATVDVDALRPPYDGFVFADVLEHLADPVAALRRLTPLLAPDGVVLATIPNVANWAIRLQLLGGRFRYTDKGILDRTHLRFFTKKTVVELFDSAGYRVDELTGTIPVPGVSWPPACRLAHRVGNLRPSFFAYTFLIVARPVG